MSPAANIKAGKGIAVCAEDREFRELQLTVGVGTLAPGLVLPVLVSLQLLCPAQSWACPQDLALCHRAGPAL